MPAFTSASTSGLPPCALGLSPSLNFTVFSGAMALSTVSGAVANSGVTDSARYLGAYSCSSWNNSGGGDYGTYVNQLGAVDVYGDCSKGRAVSCCL